LLSRTKKPQKTTAATTIDDDPVMGSPDAKVTLVEFSDYQCPYCSRFYRSTYPVIKDEFVKTGKLLYVFRDYPLPFHKKAQKAHEAANCAGEQNKYWKMHDRIFNNQQTMDVEDLRKHAETLALDTTVFNTCLNSGKHAQEINKDIEAGKTAGVQGTSSFILGMTNNNGQVKGLFISGARPTEYFRKEINKMLLQANK
jgi:protein-disulfide isomerase